MVMMENEIKLNRILQACWIRVLGKKCHRSNPFGGLKKNNKFVRYQIQNYAREDEE